MNRLYQTEGTVKKVLTEYSDSRNDDFILIYRVYKEINEEAVLRELFFEVMMNHTKYCLPSFESITRARRKVMNKHPELKPVERVVKARKEEELNYREYALDKGGIYAN